MNGRAFQPQVQDRGGEAGDGARRSKETGTFKRVCLTGPDVRIATTGRKRRLEPSYRQHGVADALLGVVLEVEVTTGETKAVEETLARLDALAETTCVPPQGQLRFGKTTKDERDRVIAAFERWEIRAHASIGVLTTGCNAPA